MFLILSRVIRYGLQNFWRNIWLSAATVAVTILALVVFLGLILFNVVTDAAIASVQEKIDISVYFKTTTPEDEILNVKQALENLAEVKSVEYISRDEALEIFKAAHEDDPTILQAINELNRNPLEASLNIKAKQPDHYGTIASYLGTPSLKQYISNVSYEDNRAVFDRLVAIIDNVNRGGFTLTVVLALIAGLMVFNTVWIAIYSNRDEIGITRVVGASNVLVRGPYLVEGVISGALAAVLSLALVAPLLYTISPPLGKLIPGLDLFRYFTEHMFLLLGYQLLFGIGVSVFSSFVAVRRYLKS